MKAKNPKWEKLSRDVQDLYIKILWEDACSEKAIADFLGTTKGTIVRRRHGLSKLDAPNRAKVDRVVNAERFWDLIELHEREQCELRRRRS